MVRSRMLGLLVFSLALAGAFSSPCWSQELYGINQCSARPTESTCKIYQLSHLGDDPSLGKWISETIPAVIEPGTWNRAETLGKCTLTYYAPGKILVVSHTSAVQEKVAAFLKDVKSSLPKEQQKAGSKLRNKLSNEQSVIPAKFTVCNPVQPVEPVTASACPYPVPAPVSRPKHLFHFIIRYEGDGIIDDSVAGVMKEYYRKNCDSATSETKPVLQSVLVSPPCIGGVQARAIGTAAAALEQSTPVAAPQAEAIPAPSTVENAKPNPENAAADADKKQPGLGRALPPPENATIR